MQKVHDQSTDTLNLIQKRFTGSKIKFEELIFKIQTLRKI